MRREGPRGRALLLVALALLAAGMVGGGLAWLLGTGSDRAERLRRAEQALAARRLEGEAGAVAIFLRVLAEEPDHELARRGLLRAGEAALAGAGEAARRGERERALALLAAARAAGVAPARLEAVQARIRALDAGREDLLAEAARAEAADEVAPELLARLAAALASDVGDEELKRRFEKLVGRRAGLAAAWLSAGDLRRARAELDALRLLAPEHAAVVALEAALLDAERGASEADDQE